MEYIYILYDTINDNPICFSRHKAELYYFAEIYNINFYRIMRVPHVADCGDWFSLFDTTCGNVKVSK